MDWKRRLDELEELIEKRGTVETEEERREIGREVERISDELRRVWQMTVLRYADGALRYAARTAATQDRRYSGSRLLRIVRYSG